MGRIERERSDRDKFHRKRAHDSDRDDDRDKRLDKRPRRTEGRTVEREARPDRANRNDRVGKSEKESKPRDRDYKDDSRNRVDRKRVGKLHESKGGGKHEIAKPNKHSRTPPGPPSKNQQRSPSQRFGQRSKGDEVETVSAKLQPRSEFGRSHGQITRGSNKGAGDSVEPQLSKPLHRGEADRQERAAAKPAGRATDPQRDRGQHERFEAPPPRQLNNRRVDRVEMQFPEPPVRTDHHGGERAGKKSFDRVAANVTRRYRDNERFEGPPGGRSVDRGPTVAGTPQRPPNGRQDASAEHMEGGQNRMPSRVEQGHHKVESPPPSQNLGPLPGRRDWDAFEGPPPPHQQPSTGPEGAAHDGQPQRTPNSRPEVQWLDGTRGGQGPTARGRMGPGPRLSADADVKFASPDRHGGGRGFTGRGPGPGPALGMERDRNMGRGRGGRGPASGLEAQLVGRGSGGRGPRGGRGSRPPLFRGGGRRPSPAVRAFADGDEQEEWGPRFGGHAVEVHQGFSHEAFHRRPDGHGDSGPVEDVGMARVQGKGVPLGGQPGRAPSFPRSLFPGDGMKVPGGLFHKPPSMGQHNSHGLTGGRIPVGGRGGSSGRLGHPPGKRMGWQGSVQMSFPPPPPRPQVDSAVMERRRQSAAALLKQQLSHLLVTRSLCHPQLYDRYMSLKGEDPPAKPSVTAGPTSIHKEVEGCMAYRLLGEVEDNVLPCTAATTGAVKLDSYKDSFQKCLELYHQPEQEKQLQVSKFGSFVVDKAVVVGNRA